MSHFTVMVIGNDPEKELAPYNENIQVDEYKENVLDIIDIQYFVEHYTNNSDEVSDKEKEENLKLTFDELYEKYGEDWNNNSWRKDEDGVYYEYSTRNPKSKWDWYELGGRWNNFLKLKDGSYCDSALKGDIDFDGMVQDAEDDALETYENFRKYCGGEIPKLEYKWDDINDVNNNKFNEMSFHQKRDFYKNQPSLLKLESLRNKLEFDMFFFYELEHFQCTIEEYIERSKKERIMTFALVKNGEWYESAKMSWFSITSNENKNWEEEFHKLLYETSDDELISIYDCHI